MSTAAVLAAAAGFAVFLCGMKLLEIALFRAAGQGLHRALERFTETPVRGLMAGSAASALLQSSTAVTVITIGLANTGLLSRGRTLGIILGTNIGTCLTTELLGLPIASLAAPLAAVSAAVWALTVLVMEYRPSLAPGPPGASGSRPLLPAVHFGAAALFGFAMLLKGISLMTSVGPAVQDSPIFDWFLARSGSGPLWGIAAGAVLTAAVHSSSAVIGLVMGLSASGALPPETGVAAVLGANIGTCFTAVAAALPGTPAGRFVALAHLLLNLAGALLFAPFTAQLYALAGALGDPEPAARIAHAQTLFNVGCSLLALPLCYLPVWRRNGG